MTVLVGLFCWWMVFNFPDTAGFLTPDERLRAQRRLRTDNQTRAEAEKISRKYVFQAIRDWKTWAYALQYMGCLCPLYAFSLFLPTIVGTMGYSGAKLQLFTVPPYAVAAILTVLIGYIADRTRARGLCNILVSILGAVGFSMLLGAKTAGTRYAGVFLGAMGIYPCIANTISWTGNNVEGEFILYDCHVHLQN